MKKLTFTAIVLIASMSMNAQHLNSNEVPGNLKTRFEKEYANAAEIEWEMDGENYQVEFEINKMDYEIWYSKNGDVVKMEKEITEQELPAAVLKSIKNKYADYTIDEIEMSQTKSQTTYEVEIEKGWLKERKLMLSDTGKILSDIED